MSFARGIARLGDPLATRIHSASFARGLSLAILLATTAACHVTAAVDHRAVHGLPLTRFYSLDEIGNISRGAQLSFDPLGRLAVIRDGACYVLNDTTWLDIADKDSGHVPMQQLVQGDDGRLFYGAFGSWGLVDVTADGRLRARSMVPATYRGWVKTSSFLDINVTPGGVYFSGSNGVVYLDVAANRTVFFDVPRATKVFQAGGHAFVFSLAARLQRIDPETETLVSIDSAMLGDAFIDQGTRLDDRRALVATSDFRLMTFDGERLLPWRNDLGEYLAGRISGLKRLSDGIVAVAVQGQGLYFLSAEGRLLSSLTDPDHHRITQLAAREPGVLWIAKEDGIEKVLYQSPLAVFGQRLGLPISWPQVTRWQDRVIVASGGRLYEARASGAGETAHFQPIPDQPAPDTWALAANGPRMLVGHVGGVFARNEDGSFARVLAGFDAARLVMISPDFCYLLGPSEIGALRWENGRWAECAPRIGGVGYPAIVHAGKESVWIELGGNRAARVLFRDGELHLRLFEQFPWQEPHWINIGMVGDIAILTGPRGGRVFFDERTESFVPAPDVEALLNRSPVWLMRVREMKDGEWWATHADGVVSLRRREDGSAVEVTALDLANDRNPHLQVLPDGDVWVSTGFCLYHLNRHKLSRHAKPPLPILTALVRGGIEETALAKPFAPGGKLLLPYSENSLGFRFFTGGYALRRNPEYEYRLNSSAQWVPFASDSLLSLSNLREGAYRLEVRLTDGGGLPSDALPIDFEVQPPWYRTWLAYAIYAALAVMVPMGLVRWMVHRTYVRNVQLERQVRERTEQLHATMAKLNSETRHAATLAERNRLAAEIHDSVQQGLSGVMLQVEAILKLPAVADAIRSRLGVVRNALSFTRAEVQHAVWDMESSLLESADLGEALRRIVEFVSTGASTRIDVHVSGQALVLASDAKHHLLRVAQEAIMNALRHAHAANIEVAFTYAAKQVSLRVSDDGRGFRTGEIFARRGHLGLHGMQDRTEKIGGELKITSAPGEGTIIEAIVPVPRACAPASTHATVG